MSEVDRNISEILEIEDETPVESTEMVPVKEQYPVVSDENRDIDFDYERSRSTHHDLLEQGQEALTDLLKVAKESQHPRAYEVAATMLKNLSDMTDKLMTLHEKKKALEKADKNSEPSGPTHATQVNANTVVFAGTSADLLKQIRNNG